MATLSIFVGRDVSDWEVILQDLLENGELSPVGGPAGTALTLTFGDLELQIVGTNLEASGTRTIDTGSITEFSIVDDGVTVLTMTGLVNAGAADLQSMLDGASGLIAQSEEFKALIAPLFTEEPLDATGSGGRDTILGSGSVDTIDAGDGNDYVRGGGGVDTLNGEGGDADFLDYRWDTRTVGVDVDLEANTVVDNDLGQATVDNISGFERVGGTDFDDILRGDAGNNVLFGNGGDDLLIGRGGDNYYEGGEGTDTYVGGTGSGDGQWDKISYIRETGGSGITATFLGGGDVSIVDTYGNTETGSGIEEVKGSRYDDTFIGSSDGESAEGSEGNDTFDMGGGWDEVDYQHEADEGGTQGVIVNLSGTTIVINRGFGDETVLAGQAIDSFGDTDTLSGVEAVYGTRFDDFIAGGAEDNYLRGDNGNDVLSGNGGHDSLDGGDGDDLLVGGSGENFFEGGAGTDEYWGGTGTGDGEWDKISYERETGGSGIVATFLGNGNVSVVDTYGNTESGSGIDEIKGSQYADTFIGSSGNDSAEGMGGADFFSLGGGFDHVDYRHEEDAGTTQGVIVNLSAASITADIGYGQQTVLAGTARDTFGDTDTFIGVEEITGTRFRDHIVGSSVDNVLRGGNGSDTLYGGGGNDVLRGDEGGEVDQGDDFLYGEGGNDEFKGGAGNDHMDGGTGTDRVRYDLETTFTGDSATHGVIVNLSTTALIGVSVAGIAATNVAAGTAIDARGYVDTLVSIEDVDGTGYDDLIHGSSVRNEIETYGGYDQIFAGGGDDRINAGTGGGIVDGGTGTDTAAFDADRADFRAIGLAGGGVRLIDLRGSTEGEQTSFTNVESFEFDDQTLSSAQMTPDVFDGVSYDLGSWQYGWHTTGAWAYGWHYETGYEFGYYSDGLGWHYGWYLHSGAELGWFTYGSWAVGWFYDYGGYGEGWLAGYGSGGSYGSLYGSWTPAPSYPQGYGYSLDEGGANYGWHREGWYYQGWHYEYGWDFGYYNAGTGWYYGWNYHAGWEYGWTQYGAWTLGWYWDFGGYGMGWYMGAAGPAYAGVEY